MREKIIIREERQDECFHYTYELILRQGKRTADWNLPLYSIRISLKDEGGNISQKEATDIFTAKERALEFFNMLVRNLATPIDLVYAVEDEVKI